MTLTRSVLRLALAFVLLLVVALAAAVQLRVTSRERAAEAAYPPIGQFIEVEGLRIHALVQGPDDAEAPDLVLIHGSGGHLGDMKISIMDELATRYRVIAFDRPGLGWSDALPKGAEGIHEQARVLQKAASALGADAPIVLGQSYGGAVALAWAVDMPDTLSALVTLAGPSHPWDTPLDTYYKVTSHPLGQLIVVPLIVAVYNDRQVAQSLEGVFAPQDPPANYAQEFGVPLTMTRERIRANARHRKLIKPEIEALHTRYREIQVPFEIVHGDKDITVYLPIHAPRMLEESEQARLTTLEGIGHMPQHVAKDAVYAAIDRAAARAGLR